MPEVLAVPREHVGWGIPGRSIRLVHARTTEVDIARPFPDLERPEILSLRAGASHSRSRLWGVFATVGTPPSSLELAAVGPARMFPCDLGEPYNEHGGALV
jgi:hypothetical protein